MPNRDALANVIAHAAKLRAHLAALLSCAHVMSLGATPDFDLSSLTVAAEGELLALHDNLLAQAHAARSRAA